MIIESIQLVVSIILAVACFLVFLITGKHCLLIENYYFMLISLI